MKPIITVIARTYCFQLSFDEEESDDSREVHIIGLSYGCQLVVEYGVRLKLLPPKTTTEVLEKLCTDVARGICKQQHNKRMYIIIYSKFQLLLIT